ncbi:DUF4160 domain-containing protein [Pelagerythrobacter marensis]|uniref:DUF4160 domain-containing protein n=1 Tax=Pelagerythrobacter marensis TaxID=543877 RepID=A0A0G3XD80_9SPHN|nr:DUF4160 domain-containing protein [Pelagerythrobacter marensis]AKM08576.1 hypothetical protein AM2010_2521 [Pelagerythrobacter marensis]
MPIISSFYGILIRMYFADHAPPHFHAAYQGHEALVRIADGQIIEGSLPNKARRIVADWAFEHRSELEANWRCGQELLPMERIPGADQDD